MIAIFPNLLIFQNTDWFVSNAGHFEEISMLSSKVVSMVSNCIEEWMLENVPRASEKEAKDAGRNFIELLRIMHDIQNKKD